MQATTVSSPIRVLLVAPSLGILGGQAVQADRLLTLLRQESSLEVDLLPVNPRLPGPLALLQRIKYLRTLLTFPCYCLLLAFRVPRWDVLHIFSASYLSFVLAPTPAILAARLFRRKSILNYHSGEAEDHLARWPSALPTIRMVDEVVVPSGYLVDVFARFGVLACPVPNCVPIEQFHFRDRRPLRPAFLSNRNLHPMYNVGNTLRAFARIQQRYPEACLDVAGDGRQRRELEQLAAALELHNVRFLGQVPPERMPALYDAADIYLNSSEIDNAPLSIIEAYAAGAAVVTTNTGGIPHIVRHEETGLLVERRNPAAMADCAIRLLQDESLAERIIAGARRECHKYAWSAVRDQWLRLYRSLSRASRP
jgi:L-malate glycosyltransferase